MKNSFHIIFFISIFLTSCENKIKKDYNFKEKKEYILIELQFHSLLISLLYVNFCKSFLSKYNIVFFYYNKLDHKFNNNLFKIILFSYFEFLKKNFNAKIINLYAETNKNFDTKVKDKQYKIEKTILQIRPDISQMYPTRTTIDRKSQNLINKSKTIRQHMRFEGPPHYPFAKPKNLSGHF